MPKYRIRPRDPKDPRLDEKLRKYCVVVDAPNEEEALMEARTMAVEIQSAHLGDKKVFSPSWDDDLMVCEVVSEECEGVGRRK